MDIDIDLPTTFNPTNHFDGIVLASMVKDGELKKHPAGVYFQTVPIDPVTSLSAIPYSEAEELGYMKIDMLHLSVLDYFESKEEVRQLIHVEPDWNLLLIESEVRKMFQLKGHFDVVYQVKPKSIMEIADTIALIRPAKRHLLDAYVKDKEKVRPFIYKKPTDDKYYYKKPHAVSYAHNIVLQMHLIGAGII